MFQTSKTSNTMQTANYFVREHRGGNPQIIRCSPPRGYPTATAAREAKIKEIEEQIRFCCETINGFMDDIEAAKKELEKVRRLSLDDKSL
jgi:hypothetical protein